MKSLFLVPYPTEGASNRIRVEQYIPYLVSMGVACRIRPFVNRPFYRILYLPHRYLEKIFWFIICTANRLFDVARALGYDIIFIHREAYPFGGAVLESILRATGCEYLVRAVDEQHDTLESLFDTFTEMYAPKDE